MNKHNKLSNELNLNKKCITHIKFELEEKINNIWKT